MNQSDSDGPSCNNHRKQLAFQPRKHFVCMCGKMKFMKMADECSDIVLYFFSNILNTLCSVRIWFRSMRLWSSQMRSSTQKQQIYATHSMPVMCPPSVPTKIDFCCPTLEFLTLQWLKVYVLLRCTGALLKSSCFKLQ